MSLCVAVLNHIADMADEYAREHGQEATAAAFAAHLRTTAAQAEEKSTREGDATPQAPRPRALDDTTFNRARKRSQIAGFFRCASYARTSAGGDRP